MKKIIAAVAAAAFVAAVGGAVLASKKTEKCTVDTVEGSKLTMTCEKAPELKAGDKVEVEKVFEGC